MANIRDGNALPWVVCKNCGNAFRMGKSCECGNVRTRKMEDGAYFVEGDSDDIVIDTEQ